MYGNYSNEVVYITMLRKKHIVKSYINKYSLNTKLCSWFKWSFSYFPMFYFCCPRMTLTVAICILRIERIIPLWQKQPRICYLHTYDCKTVVYLSVKNSNLLPYKWYPLNMWHPYDFCKGLSGDHMRMMVNFRLLPRKLFTGSCGPTIYMSYRAIW